MQDPPTKDQDDKPILDAVTMSEKIREQILKDQELVKALTGVTKATEELNDKSKKAAVAIKDLTTAYAPSMKLKRNRRQIRHVAKARARRKASKGRRR